MKSYTFVVLTQPVEGREDDYNAWYNDIHLPDLVKMPCVKSAQRYKLVTSDKLPGFSHPYMAMYQIETDDIEAVDAAIRAAAGTPAMRVTDAMDRPLNKSAYFEKIGKEAKSAD